MPDDLESGELFAQGGLDGVGDRLLVAADARDVDECGRQVDRVGGQVQLRNAHDNPS
jgi:hypothetical protein